MEWLLVSSSVTVVVFGCCYCPGVYMCRESGLFLCVFALSLARRFRPRVVTPVMGGAPFCLSLLVVLQSGLPPCGVREVTDR